MTLSALLSALCLGIACLAFAEGSWWIGLLLVGLVVGCALFSIRGYTVTPEAIFIQRLFWVTRLPLKGLRSAQIHSASPWKGIRIGNGGFFSFTGWRYNPELGFYRVFVTNSRDAVILRFPQRKVVLSPSAPEDFIRELPLPSRAV